MICERHIENAFTLRHATLPDVDELIASCCHAEVRIDGTRRFCPIKSASASRASGVDSVPIISTLRAHSREQVKKKAISRRCIYAESKRRRHEVVMRLSKSEL